MKKNIIAFTAVIGSLLAGGTAATAQSVTSTPQGVNLPNNVKQVTPLGSYTPGNFSPIDIELELGYRTTVQGFTSFNPPVTQGISPLNAAGGTYQGNTWTIGPILPGVTYVVRAKLYGRDPNDPKSQHIQLATADGDVP